MESSTFKFQVSAELSEEQEQVDIEKDSGESVVITFLNATYEDDSHLQFKCVAPKMPLAASEIAMVPLVEANVLYEGSNAIKKVMETTMDISGILDYEYQPGDSIGIIVSNSDDDVELMLKSVKLSALPDALCEIRFKPGIPKQKIPSHIPARGSARTILRDCLDLRSIPKKTLLRALAQYAENTDERNFLISVASKQGAQLYNELIVQRSQNIIDIMGVCASCRPPLSLLIEYLPPLKPRPYSIANSPLTGAKKLTVIFSVPFENRGVATTYLSQIVEAHVNNPNVPHQLGIYFRKTNLFCYTKTEMEKNVILIAVGCSVSPFLGFLEHKEIYMQNNCKDVGSTSLFVGSSCEECTVHRDRLINYRNKGVLQNLYESFSKISEETDHKYVQDQLGSHADEFVAQFMSIDTILYVCADGAAISKDIEACIAECLIKVLCCTEDRASQILAESRSSKKYREDIWT